MKQISLDSAAEDVKQFVRALPIGDEGVELALDGDVICKVIPPHGMSEAERDAVLATGWQRIREAQARNQDVPSKIIEREVNEAVDQVRRESNSSR